MLKRFMKCLFLILIALLPCALKAQSNLLENPGFEDGEKGWTLTDSTLVAEAAKKGKLGLRVKDTSTEKGAGAISTRFPVKPGQKVKVEFWAKTNDEKFIGVNLTYFAKDKSWTTDANEKLPGVVVTDATGKWKKYEFEAVVPDYVDAVAVWVHAWSNTVGTADFDDFELKFK